MEQEGIVRRCARLSIFSVSVPRYGIFYNVTFCLRAIGGNQLTQCALCDLPSIPNPVRLLHLGYVAVLVLLSSFLSLQVPGRLRVAILQVQLFPCFVGGGLDWLHSFLPRHLVRLERQGQLLFALDSRESGRNGRCIFDCLRDTLPKVWSVSSLAMRYGNKTRDNLQHRMARISKENRGTLDPDWRRRVKKHAKVGHLWRRKIDQLGQSRVPTLKVGHDVLLVGHRSP